MNHYTEIVGAVILTACAVGVVGLIAAGLILLVDRVIKEVLD